MRKLFLVLLAMTMVATMSFAQVTGELDFEAEAESIFGVNLDALTTTDGTNDGPTTGFQINTDVTMDVTFVEESTQEFGEGEVYGYLQVENFQFVMESTHDNDADTNTDGALAVDTGEVTATLFLGPAYVVIATAGVDVDNANVGLNVDESILGAPAALGTMNDDADGADGDLESPDAGNSVAVGFDVPDLFNIELALASSGDWGENVYNNYTGAIYTETTVSGFTLSVDLASSLRSHGGDPNDSEARGDFGDNGFVGVGVDYSMPLNDMMTLVPYLGLDLKNDAGAGEADSSTSGREGAFDFEVVAGANVEWGAGDLEVFAAGSDETQAGAGLEVGFSRDNGAGADVYTDALWVRGGLAEDGGDDGLLPVVGGALLVEYASVTPNGGDATNLLAFGAEVDADLGVVSPFFGLMYADTNLDADDDEGFTMELGTDVNVIDAVTFTVAYTSGNLLREGDGAYDDGTDDIASYYSYAAATADAGATAKAGTFTIGTKIAY